MSDPKLNAPSPAGLDHELAEAKAELRRHHRDFERICSTLDAYDRRWPLSPHQMENFRRDLRGIVG